jgi:hypothetical protein
MTIQLNLPEEIERDLAAEAARKGLSLSDYVTQLLEAHARGADNLSLTGEQLVERWTKAGLVGARPDIVDSQSYARELRARAERRSAN